MKYLGILLILASSNLMAAPDDDCWKMLKPFTLDARVKEVVVVDVSPYRRHGYKSINFHLTKKVPIWQVTDWDSMMRDTVSCKLKDGVLSHPYGTLSDMRANQKQVNSQKSKEQQNTQARFK